MDKYLQSFIIGSSFIVMFPYLITVPYIDRNYSMSTYAVIAPLYLGIMFSIFQYFSINYLFLQSFISATIVFFFALLTNSYNFTKIKDYILYYLRLILRHTFSYFIMNILISYL